MDNTATHFECEIDNLYYITIEREIAHYFNMGTLGQRTIKKMLLSPVLFRRHL